MSFNWQQILADRLHKQSLYGSPTYWDRKARSFEGLARSNWPSNTYNRFVHQRQMEVLDELWGDVRGWRIADIGCGTGRATLHLARRGAQVTGFDFSEEALGAARAQAESDGVSAHFLRHDIAKPVPPEHRETYDALLTIGCLTLACPNRLALARALSQLKELVRPGGRLLFIEPMHRSRLLRRILAANVRDWIADGETQGLALVRRGGCLFAPARFLLAFRDLPEPLAGPVFHAGERVLHASARLEPLADYHWLAFERRSIAPVATDAGAS